MRNSDNRRMDLDDGHAFLPDPRDGRLAERDTLAELVGEDFISSATAGMERFDEDRNAVTTDELGGPFLEVDPEYEFAMEPDASNPEDAEREAFPTAVHSQPK